jgi:uncharacterized protein YdeI (YjbR/CyaY-like superfamily)
LWSWENFLLHPLKSLIRLQNLSQLRLTQRAKKNGWWLIFDPVEDLIEPDDLRRALDTNPSARVHWDQFPPSARKIMLWWVVSAAKEETRVRRIDDIVVNASAGERARR